MKNTDLSSTPVEPSGKKESPLALYLLLGVLALALVLIALLPFFL